MLRRDKELEFDEMFHQDVGGSFAIWALPKNTRQHVKFVISPSIQVDVLGLIEMNSRDEKRLANFRSAIEQACGNGFARMKDKQPNLKLITLIRADFEPWLNSRRVSYIMPLQAFG